MVAVNALGDTPSEQLFIHLPILHQSTLFVQVYRNRS